MTDSRTAEIAPPLDLARLRAQTGGDERLERDVLGLFLVRSEADLDRIAAGSTPAERCVAAHTLVGSARAVGALAVAAAAEAIERAAPTADPASAVATLREALGDAHRLIREHLAK